MSDRKSSKKLPELPESESKRSLARLEELPLVAYQPLPPTSVPVQVKAFRALRLVMALGVATAVGLMLQQHYSNVRSRQAFINAEIVKVRNPLAGDLQLKNLQPGQSISVGENIGTVKNLRQSSELEVNKQNLISQIEQAKQTVLGVEAQIGDRRQSIAKLNQEANSQKDLGVDYEGQQIDIAKNQLDQTLFAAKTAKKELERIANLAKQGVISQDKLERSQLSFNRAQNEVKNARSQVNQAEQKVKAAQAGLQLDGSRTLGYSEIRQRELSTDINDMQQQLAEAKVRQQTTEAELVKIDRQLSLNQQAKIPSPTSGPIWSVESKSGEYAEAGIPILEVLNCQNLWVEAFFSERDAGKIYPGKPVKVRLLGAENGDLVSGKVESVRAGSGRVQTGGDIAVPPPDSLRRQVAVRVKLDRPLKVNSTQFCDVGRSAEVSFKREGGLFGDK